MSKHTQGKYTIHPTPSLSASGFTIIKQSDGEDTYHIAEVYGSDKEAQNLATLFASAPEMLKSLGLAVEEAKVVRGYSNIKPDSLQEQTLNNLINRCSSLIAKAEGGAK